MPEFVLRNKAEGVQPWPLTLDSVEHAETVAAAYADSGWYLDDTPADDEPAAPVSPAEPVTLEPAPAALDLSNTEVEK